MGNEGSSLPDQMQGAAGASSALEDPGAGDRSGGLRVRWRRVGVDGAGAEGGLIGARDGHCACSCGNKVYVFGGVVENAALGSTESNDLFVFDTETMSWKVVEAAGDIPHSRSSASMAAVGSQLFLFGGLSQSRGWMSGVHVFDTEKNSWTELSTSGSSPSPRDKLTATALGHKVYVFGGFGPVASSQDDNDSEEEEGSEDEQDGAADLEQTQEAAKFGWFNNLFVFDTATLSWSQPMQMNKAGPTRRAAHSTCAVSGNLIVFGGRDSVERRNDLHVFSTETRRWLTDLPVTGRPPAPRSFHSACSVAHRIVVFGGRGIHNEHFNDIHVLDTKTWQWLRPAIEGEAPTPRGLHTATAVGNDLVVFGGSGDFDSDTMQCQSYFADTYSLSVDELIKEESDNLVDQSESLEQRIGEGDGLQNTGSSNSS